MLSLSPCYHNSALPSPTLILHPNAVGSPCILARETHQLSHNFPKLSPAHQQELPAHQKQPPPSSLYRASAPPEAASSFLIIQSKSSPPPPKQPRASLFLHSRDARDALRSSPPQRRLRDLPGFICSAALPSYPIAYPDQAYQACGRPALPMIGIARSSPPTPKQELAAHHYSCIRDSHIIAIHQQQVMVISTAQVSY